MADETSACENPAECFYGSVTVGDRGQVVIPAALRRQLGVHPGDRLLVFRHGPDRGAIVMAKIDSLRRFLSEQLSFLDSALSGAEELDGAEEVDARADGGGNL